MSDATEFESCAEHKVGDPWHKMVKRKYTSDTIEEFWQCMRCGQLLSAPSYDACSPGYQIPEGERAIERLTKKL